MGVGRWRSGGEGGNSAGKEEPAGRDLLHLASRYA